MTTLRWAAPVSYTHLDVYKRQVVDRAGVRAGGRGRKVVPRGEVVVGNSGADALDPVMDDGGAYLGLLFGWTMPDAGEDLKLGDEQVPRCV